LSVLSLSIRSRRRLIAVVLLLLTALALAALRFAGLFLSPQDSLTTADAIFVLAGTRAERPLEAADLFHEGYAPTIVITRATSERAITALAARGVMIPTDFDLTRDAMTQLGVPAAALITPERIHDNTGQEAATLRQLALSRGWRRVIVVTSVYHLRRTALACRRALAGTGVEVLMRGSRYDRAAPGRWWSTRNDIRWVVSELPKFLAYRLGIGL
jgi:uncharacterized SAM-binding protein YcdF (DUF218 family)